MKKGIKIILLALVTGFVICGGLVIAVTSDHGTAFKDYDVNEDKQFTPDDIADMVYLWFETHGFTVSPPTVSKYDMDLDADFDTDDVNITYDDYMDERHEDVYQINMSLVWDQITNDPYPTYILYDSDINEIHIGNTTLKIPYSFYNWFGFYTPVRHHTYSCGFCGGGPTTQYHYVCYDYAVDTYWLFNKNFFNTTNYYDNNGNPVIVLPPVALGRSFVPSYSAYHDFNWILISDDWQNPDSWLIFEPQLGIAWTVSEALEQDCGCLREKYLNGGNEMWIYYDYLVNGEKYTLHIKINLTTEEVTVTTHSGDWFSHPASGFPEYPGDGFRELCGDEYAGVELDHKAPSASCVASIVQSNSLILPEI